VVLLFLTRLIVMLVAAQLIVVAILARLIPVMVAFLHLPVIVVVAIVLISPSRWTRLQQRLNEPRSPPHDALATLS
jgi:hypothetical protein